jgi:hypothetical protein
LQRAFNIAAVNLKGINTGSLEGGPRLIFENGQVLISRVELGVFRTGPMHSPVWTRFPTALKTPTSAPTLMATTPNWTSAKRW